MNFSLTTKPIDPRIQRAALRSPSAGGYCSYEGWVRDTNQGKAVSALHYTGYPELAPAVAHEIIAEAERKFSIERAAVVHRVGALVAGDLAVWVGVTSHHRDAAFLACRYIIDNVKYRLPIWKKEIYTDGSEAWIENHSCGCAEPSNLNHSRPPDTGASA